MTDKTISPLRQRMTEDMTIRGFTVGTQRGYLVAVENFTSFLDRAPDGATAEDLRRYQLHMRSSGASATAMNTAVSALRFFFGVTLGRGDAQVGMTTVREPHKLPVVLSPEEVARLLDAAPRLKYRAALSVSYGAGLRASEVVSLKLADIDSERMAIRVEQGKGRKDRYAMLSEPLLRLLRAWWLAARERGVMLPGGLAVSGPEPGQPVDHPPVEPSLPRRQDGGRYRQAGLLAHPQALLRDPSAGAESRHPGDPGVAGAQQTRYHRALQPPRQHHPARRQKPARSPQPRTLAARLSRRRHGASGSGGRGHLPRPRPCLA